MQAAGERRLSRGGRAATAFLDPGRYRLQIGPGLAAQRRRLARERLVQLSLARALKNPGDLGQQVSAPARELPQRRHRSVFLVAAQLAPLRPVARLAVDPGDEQAVSFRAPIDHAF